MNIMNFMFNNCINLKKIPLLNTKNVKEVQQMFVNCKKLRNTLNIDLSQITKNNKNNMYKNCNLLEKIENHKKEKSLKKQEKQKKQNKKINNELKNKGYINEISL